MSDTAVIGPGTSRPVERARDERKFTAARGLAAFGAVIAVYEISTWARWLWAGPQQITAYRDTTDASWYAARGYELLVLAVAVFLFVRVLRQCLRERRLTLDAQMLIGGVAALFWDPFGNFVQPAFFYSSNWLNLNTWTGFAPLVVNPDASRMPQPVFIMLVYPFGLLAFAMIANAVMRLTQKRFPQWSNVRIAATGGLAATILGMALEAPMFLTHLWSLPGAPTELALFDNGHRYAAVEYLTTGIVFAGWAIVRYFKDDQGKAFTERGVGPAGSVLAMIGWCTALMFALQFFVTLFAFKAAPYPEEFPRHLVNDICNVGETQNTRYGPCPGSPDFKLPTHLPGPAPFN
jgi:hypothetical protein